MLTRLIDRDDGVREAGALHDADTEYEYREAEYEYE